MSRAWPACRSRPSRGWCTARTGSAMPPGPGSSRPSKELGYVPNAAAQSLSRRRKDVSGLACKERDTGWSLLIDFLHGNDTGRAHLAGLDALSGKADGILIGEGFGAAGHIQRLAARVPVVIIAGAVCGHAADVVAADNFSGSAAITTHLIAGHGKRRLFHLDGPSDAPDAVERRLGLFHPLRGDPHCRLIGSAHGTFSVRTGQQARPDLLGRP